MLSHLLTIRNCSQSNLVVYQTLTNSNTCIIFDCCSVAMHALRVVTPGCVRIRVIDHASCHVSVSNGTVLTTDWMVSNRLCLIFKHCSQTCLQPTRQRMSLLYRHQNHGQLCQENNSSLTLTKAPNLCCFLAELHLLLLLVKKHLNAENPHPLPLPLHLPTSFLHATNTWTQAVKNHCDFLCNGVGTCDLLHN